MSSPDWREPQRADIVGVASVIDDDTIEIHRLDAPESVQPCRDDAGRRWRCGQQAALAIQELIGRRTVTCDERDLDRYGRIVGRSLVGEVDINQWLVAQGLALAYRRYHGYVPAEDKARAAHVGGHVRAALRVAEPTMSGSGVLSPIELAGIAVRR
jgi:endonuclease YncB( thermonuclease family)